MNLSLSAVLAIVLSIILTPAGAFAEIYGGIDFPDGEASFADQVLRYDPLHCGGPAPTDPNYLDPQKALGPPGGGAVSLGRGGLLELRFVDNVLANSGDDGLKDVHIFEVGPDVEDTFVAIRPTAATFALLDPSDDADGDGFFEIGKVFGSTSSIDIDLIFTGFSAATLQFDAIQLIDDYFEGNSGGSTVGADITAVGAISSLSLPQPIAVFDFEDCLNSSYLGPGAQGGVGCGPGRPGYGAVFGGGDDAIEICDEPRFHFTDKLTVAAWVKPDKIHGTLISKWYALDSYLLSLEGGDAVFSVAFPGGQWGTSKNVRAPIAAGKWTHVAGVFNGKSITLYLNGHRAAVAKAPGTLQQSDRPLVFGNYPSWGAYDGQIDTVRLWNVPLSAGQVALAATDPVEDSQPRRETRGSCTQRQNRTGLEPQ